jgi:Uma2 family endonuclease
MQQGSADFRFSEGLRLGTWKTAEFENRELCATAFDPRRGRIQFTIEVPEREGGIRLPPQEWTEDEFFDFCQANGDLRIERAAKGEIIVISPAGGYSSFQSGEVFSQLQVWGEKEGTGLAFDCSIGFLLPTGGMRSPDAAWVKRSRLDKLTHREKEKFIPLCPDFLIEVASPTDRLRDLLEKMEEHRTVRPALRMAAPAQAEASASVHQRCTGKHCFGGAQPSECRPVTSWFHFGAGKNLGAALLSQDPHTSFPQRRPG